MRSWTLRLPLPPNQNHMYIPIRGGGKALSAAAREFRAEASAIAAGAGFAPSLRSTYSVMAWLTFPTASWDIDGCVKALLDALFSARCDHRVYSLTVRKAVERGAARCTVRIIDLEVLL